MLPKWRNFAKSGHTELVTDRWRYVGIENRLDEKERDKQVGR